MAYAERKIEIRSGVGALTIAIEWRPYADTASGLFCTVPV
nr:hypothetical protein [uncultured bacterium]